MGEASVRVNADVLSRRSMAAWGLGLALLVAAPFAGVYVVSLANALCFAIFAMAFNLLLGYTGLLSFGHAAFFGGAAYITGGLIRNLGWSPELGLLGGFVAGGLLGGVIGAIAIRRQGIYFAMITLALAEVVNYACKRNTDYTGGEDGFQGIERGSLFHFIPMSNDLVMYFVVLALVVAVFLVVMRVIHSPFGQVLKAIRENEPRAVSLGYDVDRFKLMAFVLSAALSGFAGGLKAVVSGSATLTDVNWPISGAVILMTLLGGLGTFAGPIVGAITIIGLENFLADRAGSWIKVIIGAIFVVCVLAFRRGFIGELLEWQKRLLRKAG
jgi:branched-chain amino acid transport system permease protein